MGGTFAGRDWFFSFTGEIGLSGGVGLGAGDRNAIDDPGRRLVKPPSAWVARFGLGGACELSALFVPLAGLGLGSFGCRRNTQREPDLVSDGSGDRIVYFDVLVCGAATS